MSARSFEIRSSAATAVLVGLLRCADAFAEGHPGAVGLLVSAGGELRGAVGSAESTETYGLVLDLGLSAAIDGDGNAVVISGRAGRAGDTTRFGATASYRGYFGSDEWKTFFDLGVASEVHPRFGIGPRLGLGLQLDVHPLFGAFVLADARALFGGGSTRTSVSLSIGFQARTYWWG